MKKIGYLLYIVLVIVVIILIGNKDDLKYDKTYYSLYGYEIDTVFLLNDDEYIPNIEKQFADLDINISDYEIKSSNETVTIIENNKVIGKNTGIATINVILYDYENKLRYIVPTVYARVFMTKELVEIRTAEDLVNISNDLDGHYILKADIDLGDYSPWVPIDLAGEIWIPLENGFKERQGFSGIFINPEGYKIKNLTITHESATYDDGRFCSAGLFSAIENAYIDGIILENVNIDVSNFTNSYRTASAGGIACYILSSTIRNCQVTGTVISQFCCGGIVGNNSWGYIFNCSFEGTVRTINDSEDKKSTDSGAGGIAGYSGTDDQSGGIFKCTVIGTINGHYIAGGIVGTNYKYNNVYNCTFEGTVEAEIKNDIIGYIKLRVAE